MDEKRGRDERRERGQQERSMREVKNTLAYLKIKLMRKKEISRKEKKFH